MVLTVSKQVKIKINFLFMIVLLVFLFVYPKETLIIIASLLWHEFCHALAGRAYGLKAVAVELLPCGGRLVFEDISRLTTCQLICTALAGPIGSLLLGVVGWNDETCCTVNLMLAVFNLCPIMPLDGGVILQALLRAYCQEKLVKMVLVVLAVLAVVGIIIKIIYDYYTNNNLTISLLIMAGFIIQETVQEQQRYKYNNARCRIEKMFAFVDKGWCPGRIYVVSADMLLLKALKNLPAKESGVFLLLNQQNKVIKIFSEFELWDKLAGQNGGKCFKDLLK